MAGQAKHGMSTERHAAAEAYGAGDEDRPGGDRARSRREPAGEGARRTAGPEALVIKASRHINAWAYLFIFAPLVSMVGLLALDIAMEFIPMWNMGNIMGTTEPRAWSVEALVEELSGRFSPAGLRDLFPTLLAMLPFMAIGFCMLKGGRFVLLDRARGEVVMWWQLFVKFGHRTYPLKSFRAVTVDWELLTGFDDTAGAHEHFAVRLEGPDERLVLAWLGRGKYAEAIRRAERVGRFLGMQVVDRARGAVRRRGS